MVTLLWIALGVLLALVSWFLPEAMLIIALVVVGLVLVAILLPRDVTVIGAKVGIGFGGLFTVVFGRFLIPDPLDASGETYLVVAAGLLLLAGGLIGVWRNRQHQRRQRALKAAADLL